jgi:class 3 adenylate cyclase/tetratricopeptide (TPR) repeat protein
MRCSSCGRENPVDQAFCGACGHRLESGPPPATEVRKIVTVLFSDVAGSTALGEQLDPETLRWVMTRYFDAMRTTLESHGGTVEKFIGDAVMAVFGVPVVHEDDALRAVRAAAEMGEVLEELNAELERERGVTITNRTGVNTGEVVTGTGGQTIVTGDAVNTAARLEQGAEPGQVLLGEPTYRLVRGAVVAEEVPSLRAKGKLEPLHAWRLLEVRPGASAIPRRLDTRMVGRGGEMRALGQALDRAVARRGCELVTILGVPGVGKSRLVEEFLSEVDGEALRGRCLPYGEGITYWPIVEMLGRAAGLSDRDDSLAIGVKLKRLCEGADELVIERLAQLLGAGEAPAVAEETFWAVRMLFETLARSRPLVVDLDDIQWAEPALVDLIEYVAAWIRDAQVLLLCSARPDLLDARPSWGNSIRHATTLALEPLSADEAERLAGELVDGLPPEVAARIATVAEGIPLFVEQLTAMLVDDGTLVREGDRWTATGDVTALVMPPTMSALIQARLERLPPEELDVLALASIEGKTFHRGAVHALAAGMDRDLLSTHLLALVRRDLITPGVSQFTGDDGYAFRHLMIRDAAYERIPKQRRADLHARYAGWLDEVGIRAAEFDEIVGYHLERASRLLGELSADGERASDLGLRASERLGTAGRRAFARGDTRAAGSLLSRADALLPTSSPARSGLLLDLALVHEQDGRFEEEIEELDVLESIARETDDVGVGARALVRRQWVRSHTEEAQLAELQLDVEALVPALEGAGEDVALAEVNLFLGVSSYWLGYMSKATGLLELAHARAARAGAQGLAMEAASWLPPVMASSSMPASGAVERWREICASTTLSRRARAMGDHMTSPSLAMTGDLAGARRLFQSAYQVLEELQSGVVSYAANMMGAQVELLAGDATAAYELSVVGDRGLEEREETGYRSTVLCRMADALQVMGRSEEAIEAADRANGMAFLDDMETHSGWRSAKARALADLGSFDEALRIAQEALDVLAATEAFDNRSRCASSLAYVLASARERTDAAAAYRQALEMLELKGNVVSAVRVRRTLAVLGGDDPGPAELPPGAWGTSWPLNAG